MKADQRRRNRISTAADTVTKSFRRSLPACIHADASDIKELIGMERNPGNEDLRLSGGAITLAGEETPKGEQATEGDGEREQAARQLLDEVGYMHTLVRDFATSRYCSQIQFLCAETSASWTPIEDGPRPQSRMTPDPSEPSTSVPLGGDARQERVARELMDILTRSDKRSSPVESPPAPPARRVMSVSRPGQASPYNRRDPQPAEGTISDLKDPPTARNQTPLRVANHPTTKSRRLRYRNGPLSVIRENHKNTYEGDVREHVMSLLDFAEPPKMDDAPKSSRLDSISENDNESSQKNASIPVTHNPYHGMSSPLCYGVEDSPTRYASKVAVFKMATGEENVSKRHQCAVVRTSGYGNFVSADVLDEARGRFERRNPSKEPVTQSRPSSPMWVRCNISPVEIVKIAPRQLTEGASTLRASSSNANLPHDPHRYARSPKIITAPKPRKPAIFKTVKRSPWRPVHYVCAAIEATQPGYLTEIQDPESPETLRKTYVKNTLIRNIDYGTVEELQEPWYNLARVALVGRPTRVVMVLNSGVGRFIWEADDTVWWVSLCSQKASLPCVPVHNLKVKRVSSWNMLGTGDYCPMSKSSLDCLIPERSLVQLSLDRADFRGLE